MATVEKAKMNSNAVEDSLARVFFAADSEAAINEQINHEYTMSYVYHAVSLHTHHHTFCTWPCRMSCTVVVRLKSAMLSSVKLRNAF